MNDSNLRIRLGTSQFMRDGTSQHSRSLRALSPDYVSVDERTLVDWLKFAQAFAKELTYFNENNQPDGDWSKFFEGDAQAIASAMEALESNSLDKANIPTDIRDRIAQPHFALFLTFLKLLEYPQQQFKELTQRRLDFYYQQVLRLSKKSGIPDHVHIVFSLAPNQTNYLLKQGTRLNAGEDAQGKPLHYATDTDLFISKAQVASIKTTWVKKAYISLKEIHQRENQKFEEMLRWAVGSPNQGDPLPLLESVNGVKTPMSVDQLNTMFRNLKEEKQKPANSGLPLLSIAANLNDDKFNQWYILEQLCFASLEDFYTCFNTYDRELATEEASSKDPLPTEKEWQQVYEIVERAYRKKINRDRRNHLKQIHQSTHEDNFLGLWKFALGDPASGGVLPESKDIEGLKKATSDYIQNQLFLSDHDFQTIMALENTELNNPKWEEAYRLLEQAQSRKQGFTYPPISRIEKRSIHATTVAEAKPNQSLGVKRFHPFVAKAEGTKRSDESYKTQALGIAIASPVLYLQEGTRIIKLTLVCQAGTLPSTLGNLNNSPFNERNLPLALEISSTNGWLPISGKEIQVTTQYSSNTLPQPQASLQSVPSTESENLAVDRLELNITLDATQPAVTAPPPDDSILFQTSNPVIRMTLKEDSETANQKTPYQLFQNLCLQAVEIQVSVTGLKNLQLRNDRTIINSKSSFEPFGSQPTVGASFYFAHPEVVSKKLDSLSLKLEWMGLPKSFTDHYSAYFNCGLLPQTTRIDNSSFKAKLEFFINHTCQAIDDGNLRSLFSTQTKPAELLSSATLQYGKKGVAAIPVDACNGILNKPISNDLLEQDRYFRMELAFPDFQHDLYPLVLNKVARSQENEFVKDAEGKDTTTKIRSLSVYPPYNPKLKSIAIDYEASTEISLKPNADNANAGQIFQLHPFGYIELLPLQMAEKQPPYPCFFLPQYNEEGYLYIGLRELHPAQSLTLLVQLVSGSGNANLPVPKIQWSYLAEKGWQEFQPNQVLADSTNGLLDSGILQFDIPEAATKQNPLMPVGLYWLRASVTENAATIPDVLNVRTQAVKTTFVDQGNDPDQLSQPLAAQSIQALVERDSAISKVEQPYSSFGGRPPETQQAFYTRASERLRHKQRAITSWDYERLVLEHFPQIYKAKCLTQTEQNLPSEQAQVTVVVIPNLANTAPFLPLEPKAPQYLLREIEAYLQSHVSPFVKVVAKNPHYEQIKYRVDVKLREGTEQGYYLKKLNEELVQFLSPWAYEEQSDIVFGSSIHSSTVIHFLETRSYVDYVANLKLIEQISEFDEEQFKESSVSRINATNIAQVKRVDSILVSASEHIIGLISTTDYQEEVFEGINYMIIGIDFVVA